MTFGLASLMATFIVLVSWLDQYQWFVVDYQADALFVNGARALLFQVLRSPKPLAAVTCLSLMLISEKITDKISEEISKNL